jgi:hypothetical protein
MNGTGLRWLSTLFNVGVLGDVTDGQFVERFATGHGEAAATFRGAVLFLLSCKTGIGSIPRAPRGDDDRFLADLCDRPGNAAGADSHVVSGGELAKLSLIRE